MTLLSPREVAARFGFTDSYIRKLIKQGKIKCEKVGRYYVIEEKSINNLKRQRKAWGSSKTNDEG